MPAAPGKRRQLADSDLNPSARRGVPAVHLIPVPVRCPPTPCIGEFRIGSGVQLGLMGARSEGPTVPGARCEFSLARLGPLLCPIVVVQ